MLVVGFALYDIRHKRVPNKALVLSLPFFLSAPVLPIYVQNPSQIPSVLLGALLGSAIGFGVLLAAALFSKPGAGVGGGDIKLAAAMGFAYGANEMLCILLTASLLCIPVVIICRKAKHGQALSLPFVPFMAVGCLVVAGIRILI
ncbi:prepilin peptidase [Anaerotignum sp.]|uniref:prepilin peptidase n=1 Tax=Anaerotignum sp. TaxID=2039241 RepID=UPI0028AB6BEE|nr:prepilin peptidase [Anaerotignum sp.]